MALRGEISGSAAFSVAGSAMSTFCWAEHCGWIPYNASFGFLDRPRAVLGQIHFLDRF
jgi:hypothetical protein